MPSVHAERQPLQLPSFPPLTDEKIRKACYEYIDDTCCYGSRAIRDMTFTNTTNHISLHYKLESLVEERQSEERRTPFYGQSIDGSENGPSPVPWDIIIERPTKLREGKYEMEIPHSAYIKTCWRCDGCCKVKCPYCGGKGWRSCKCVKEESYFCSTCNRTERETCWCCSGAGNVKCKICDGRGKLKHYLELIVTWKTHVDEFASNHMKLSAELIHEASGVRVFREENSMISPISHSADSKINEASHLFVEKHKDLFSDEFIVLQRQTLLAIPVTKVDYKWRRKEGEFYLYSQDNKVYFEDYPQKCCLCIFC